MIFHDYYIWQESPTLNINSCEAVTIQSKKCCIELFGEVEHALIYTAMITVNALLVPCITVNPIQEESKLFSWQNLLGVI
jgi:hypothetical protein